MRGVRPRRARDGWEGSPEQMAAVETARLIIDPFISKKGVEGGLKGRKNYPMLKGEAA